MVQTKLLHLLLQVVVVQVVEGVQTIRLQVPELKVITAELGEAQVPIHLAEAVVREAQAIILTVQQEEVAVQEP
jgi:hypothetical protein